jgi:superfamily I DNA and/or RNA helicase
MRDRVPGLDFRQSLTRRGGQTGEAQYAHTVDSFQGNEADIVIISLVRNNHYAAPDGLGFLLDRERMNVLISRASRLLVLIGSWSFFERQVENMNRPDVEHVQNLLLGLAALRQTGRLAVIPCNSI